MISVALLAASNLAERNRYLAAWTRWITAANKPADEDIRNELIKTVFGYRVNFVFCVACVTCLIACYGIFYDLRHAEMLFATMIPFALLRCLSSSARRTVSPFAFVAIGLGWAATLGFIVGEIGKTGQMMLTVFSGITTTGMAFGGAFINAGTPRYAKIHTLLIIAPYSVMAGLSGAPGMLVILLQFPFWLLGIFALIDKSHENHAKLIRAQQLTRHLAFHDNLTGLPNRAQFMERLATECERISGNTDRCSYVLYLDLDGFKKVNDTLGHGAGDELLRAVAGRFQSFMRPEDMFGRLGGDEFAVILPSMTAPQAEALGARLIAAAREPFMFEGMPEIHIGVSIGGVALAPPPDVRRTLHAADTMLYAALYAAKNAGKGTIRLAYAA